VSSLGRILLLDDDETIREVVEMALSVKGYEVLTAPNGALALDLIRRHPPSLILLDMRMPVMDGWEFARRYREMSGPQAPIIVLTAAVDPADRAQQIEADGFLAKPFSLKELRSLVDRYLSPRQTTVSAGEPWP
jgi:two-component system chemotaxis response regulator CheY